MTFDFDGYRIVSDGDFWTLQKRRTRLVKATGESKTIYESFCYTSTLYQSLTALIQRLALEGSPQTVTVEGYVDRLEHLWAEISRVLQKGGFR